MIHLLGNLFFSQLVWDKRRIRGSSGLCSLNCYTPIRNSQSNFLGDLEAIFTTYLKLTFIIKPLTE